MMLYIHVPFCASRCSYCAFYSTTNSTEYLELYMQYILEEIQYKAERVQKNPITSIFFGGGTPSYIPAEYVATILQHIAYYFTLAEYAEISIEVNPESLTVEKARLWYNAGINRLSIGCQSFDRNILHLLERKHSVADIYTAIDSARLAGFSSINLDLIWGHSYQTTYSWLEDIAKAIDTGIEHLSTYSLSVEENTRLATQHNILCTLPTEEDLCEMYLSGIDLLEKHAFIQYEVSNFAKEGHSCIHNQGYWNGEHYLGFGPSASSYSGTYRNMNPHNLVEWIDIVKIAMNGSADIEGIEKEYIDVKTACIEALFLGLRQKLGFYMPSFYEYTGKIFVEEYDILLQQLLQEKLIYIEDEYCKLEKKGFLVVDEIIVHFIQNL